LGANNFLKGKTMTRLTLFVLALTLTAMGCATPPSPIPSQHIFIGEIKDLQTRILLELNRHNRKSNEDHYLKLVEKIPEGVILSTMFGDILEANPAFETMMGYSLEELKNLNWQKVTPARWYEKDNQMIAEAMTKEQVSFQKELVNKNGAPFFVDLTVWIIKDKNGNLIGSGYLVKPALK
jgi:PAS domain S-box-containing protein